MTNHFARLLSLATALGFAACADAPTSPDLDAPTGMASVGKVVVCHVDDEGRYRLISVGSPALAAHTGHGDGQPGDALADHSGFFTADCGVTRIVLDYSTTVGTGEAGGGGGGAFNDACPAGHAAVGLSGDRVTPDYFGWAALRSHRIECRELRGDGTLGASSSTPPRGSLFNIPPQDPYTGICSSDGLLVGAAGAAHQFVRSISGSCASVATLLAMGPPSSTIGPWAGGGSGASVPYSQPCPAGYAVTATTGGSGDVLDRVGFRCTQVVQVTS